MRPSETEERKDNLPRAGLVLLGKSTVSFAGSSVGFFPLEIKKRGEGIKSLRKERIHLLHCLLFESDIHQVGEKYLGPPACPSRGLCRNKDRKQAATRWNKDDHSCRYCPEFYNRDCCPEVACHGPLAQKSETCFSGLPQLNSPTCIHREGLGKETIRKLKPKHAN